MNNNSEPPHPEEAAPRAPNMSGGAEVLSLYTEDHTYGISQLESLSVILKLIKAAPAESITPGELIKITAHAGDLLAMSIAALDNVASI